MRNYKNSFETTASAMDKTTFDERDIFTQGCVIVHCKLTTHGVRGNTTAPFHGVIGKDRHDLSG